MTLRMIVSILTFAISASCCFLFIYSSPSPSFLPSSSHYTLIEDASTYTHFLELVTREIERQADDGLVHVRLGAVGPPGGGISNPVATPGGVQGAGISKCDALLLSNSSWSWKVYDNLPTRLKHSKAYLSKVWPVHQEALERKWNDPEFISQRNSEREEILLKIQNAHMDR